MKTFITAVLAVVMSVSIAFAGELKTSKPVAKPVLSQTSSAKKAVKKVVKKKVAKKVEAPKAEVKEVKVEKK